MKLLDNIYVYLWDGQGNNSNTFLVAGEVPVLVDPGHVVNEMGEPCHERLLQSLAEDGFKPDDIGLIVNTHTHPDHCEANRMFQHGGKVKIAFHEEEERDMPAFFRAGDPGFQADFYLDEGDLKLGRKQQTTFRVFHTPGHSRGSICLYLPQSKALITGDLIFALSIGRTDIPGGDFAALTKSVRRMSELDVECLLPGHMDIVQGKQNVERNFRYIDQAFFG
ncbi:MAG: MBL fold metallo-hydrolase [Dehalococcoidia bacterium]|nr:MBL fold metallo-hydrolase [Dehalococcoidia bacterium]